MASSLPLFVFVTSLILIANQSQGAPMKNHYITLKLEDIGRLSHLLRSVGDFQIDPKPWNKREIEDQLTATTKPALSRLSDQLQNEIYTDGNIVLENIGKNLPPSDIDVEQRGKHYRSTPKKWLPSAADGVPVYYFN